MAHESIQSPGVSSRSVSQQVIARVIRHPFIVLITVLLVTAGLGSSLPRLQFGTAIYDLIIEDIPENADYAAYKRDFGADEIIRIVVRNRDAFSDEAFRDLTDMADRAGRIAGVRQVISLPGIKKTIDPSGAMPLERFRTVVAPAALFEKNLISGDGRSTTLTLLLKDDAVPAAVIASVQSIVDDYAGKAGIYQVGMPLVSEALAEYTASDFTHLPAVTLGVIAALLAVLLGSLPLLVLPVAVVVIAQIWTFGLMAWMEIPLSMLTMIVPIFIIAVGTAYCLHIGSEYRALSRQTPNHRMALFEAFSKLTFPTTLAVMTTLAGIGSLGISRIVAIREFSLFACFGMVSLLVLTLSFFPAALALFAAPPSAATRPAAIDRLFSRFLERLVWLNIRHRRVCLWILAAVMLFCLAGVFRIRVETNPVEYFKRDTPVSRHFHDIYRDLSGSFPMHVVVNGPTEGHFEELDAIRELDRFQSSLENLPGVDKILSFNDYLKLVNYALNRYDPKFYALPEEGFELRMLINNFKGLLGEEMLSRFMSADFSRANLMLLTHISSSRAFLSIQREIDRRAGSALSKDMRWEVTGLGIVMSASSHHLTTGQVQSLSLALVLIFAIMVALFLSSKVGLVAVLPNLVPILMNFGLMGWLGIHLSVATSLIASIAIGLAVDDTIHYLFRYNNEFKRDLNKDRALTDTIMSVGRPILSTTVTIGLGFMILMFSHFKPTALFGLLMTITLFSALVGDLILLPSLMLHVELVTAWDLLKQMPTLGGVPPGVAHELKQPLNAIKVGSDYLKMMIARGQPVSQAQLARVVNEISSQVSRAAIIIDRLLMVGQREPAEPVPLDINGPAREILQLVENELKLDNITLDVSLADGLPPIHADARRLGQVFYNVLANAREAMADMPGAGPTDRGKAIRVRTFADSGRVTAEVTDTGPGIPGHLKNRVFEPFFSTKGTGRGLGLSTAAQIVKGHGGTIHVEIPQGGGTTIRVAFPAAEKT